MILNRMRCHSVVLAFACSRSYGVHKAHATAVAACTHRTHETPQVLTTQGSNVRKLAAETGAIHALSAFVLL